MKANLTILMLIIAFLFGCKKDVMTTPIAAFTFRTDTSSAFKMATYDTCTLFNSSVNSDSSFWDLGNGNISRDKNLILTYTNSGMYLVKLTVKNKEGVETSVTKKVFVLDRVLKRIIIKSVFWDTIPNSIPNFNAVWPTSSKADIFVQVQKFSLSDSIVPYSGILPNSPVLYKSPIIQNISNHTTTPIVIDVPNKFIVDKKMVLDRTFAISLMAKDSSNVVYNLLTNISSGVNFGIFQESFANNKFVLKCDLFSSLEFDCDFE